MSEEPEKLDNSLTGRTEHEHAASEMTSDSELRNHMVKHHGWTLNMIHQRGYRAGGYLREFHRVLHVTAHLGPEYEDRTWTPKEF
jgi:hypothetical protein